MFAPKIIEEAINPASQLIEGINHARWRAPLAFARRDNRENAFSFLC
jgi:hypothetical protein